MSDSSRILPVAKGSRAPRIFRDVKVECEDLPLWSVDALFNRLHLELDKPNIGEVTATLTIHYDMNEEQFGLLQTIGDKIWQVIHVEVVGERVKEVTP